MKLIHHSITLVVRSLPVSYYEHTHRHVSTKTPYAPNFRDIKKRWLQLVKCHKRNHNPPETPK